MADNNQHIEPTTPSELDQPTSGTGEELAKPQEEQAGTLGTPDDGSEDELEAQLAYEALKRRKQKQRRRRIILIVLALALIGGGAAFFMLSGQGEDPAVEMANMAFENPVEVTRGHFEATVGGSGSAQPLSQSVVSPEVDGIIENLNASVGQQVNEGDVLFTLKNSELDAEVEKKQQALDTAVRARDSADRKISAAYGARDDAWNRANEADDWSTYDDRSLTEAINDAIDNYNTAVAQVSDAESDLQRAQEAADKRTVTAPITGAIVAVNATNGQAIGSATGGSGSSSSSSSGPLVQIADTSQMKVTVQINEIDIEQIAVGQSATVTFQAIPDLMLDAQVQSIATVASGSGSGTDSRSSGSGGVVTYDVDLQVPNDDAKIKPGMTATVTIVTKSLDDVLIVPASAVFGVDEGAPYVLRITDAENHEYEQVSVTVVEQSPIQIAVDGDVAEGDQLLGTDPDAASLSMDM